MNGPTLVIRADATPAMGTGHVMRCLALAQEWLGQGGAVTLVSAALIPALAGRLQATGVACVGIPEAAGSPADARAAAAVARALGADWIVLDGYHFSAAYQEAIRGEGLRLLVMDDTGDGGRYSADLIVNQNLGAEVGLYGDRTGDARLLLGSRYALLRQEFRRHWTPARTLSARVNRVLVTMGGTDPTHASRLALEALTLLTRPDWRVTVLIGRGYPEPDDLIRVAEACPFPVAVVLDPEQVVDTMAATDLAIAAAGSTAWELAYLGIPSVLVVAADNQRASAAHLVAAGAARSAGDRATLTASDLAACLSPLLDDAPARLAFSQAGRRLVDGFGAHRVISAMQDLPLTLRPVGPDDGQRLWEWANEPEVRAVSFAADPIPWDRHCQWFASVLQDPDHRLVIAEDPAGHALGLVRFVLQGSNATVSVNLDRQARGRGIGSILIASASQLLFSLTRVQRLRALIKTSNERSRRAFERAGYRLGQTTDYDGEATWELWLDRPADSGGTARS